MTSTDPQPLTEAWMSSRFSVTADYSFDELTSRFESAVPLYPGATFAAMVERGATWDEIIEFSEGYAALGLLRYWGDSVTRLMSLAGNSSKCTFYFIGNFPIAERMYRFEPRVMNYAPLRFTLSETADGVVQLTTDQPSSEFGSFGDPRISAVGRGVDRKVAQLLRTLALPVPAALEGD